MTWEEVGKGGRRGGGGLEVGKELRYRKLETMAISLVRCSEFVRRCDSLQHLRHS